MSAVTHCIRGSGVDMVLDPRPNRRCRVMGSMRALNGIGLVACPRTGALSPRVAVIMSRGLPFAVPWEQPLHPTIPVPHLGCQFVSYGGALHEPSMLISGTFPPGLVGGHASRFQPVAARSGE